MHIKENEADTIMMRMRQREEFATMTPVKQISSRSEIPEDTPFVLVTFGDEAGKTQDGLGLIITVPHGTSMAMSELSFTAALHAAKEIAKHGKIPTVYATK